MVKLQYDRHIYTANLYSYCYNDPINQSDQTGYGGADALLNAIITAFKIIVGINDMASASNYSNKELKKIKKTTRKSNKQILREIEDAKRTSKKLTRGFTVANIILTIMSVILLIYSCISATTSIIRAITDCVVELFIMIAVEGVSGIVSILLNLIPIPGVVFVIGIAAGIIIEQIFASWFNSRKTTRIKNKFYSLAAPMIKNKSLDIFKYVKHFASSLSA